MSPETKLTNTEAPAQEQPTPAGKSKPVLGYIMILFVAAFLLMTLSFLMHQRSNTEAMGQLQTSFSSTIEDLQEMQERIVSLEKDLTKTKTALENTAAELEETQSQLNASDTALKESLAMQEALNRLYCLLQKYEAKQYEACQLLIQAMERDELVDILPSTPLDTESGSVPAPYVRFQQIKSAVQAAQAG